MTPFIVTHELAPEDRAKSLQPAEGDLTRLAQIMKGYVVHRTEPVFCARWVKSAAAPPSTAQLTGDTYRHQSLDVTLYEIAFTKSRPAAAERLFKDACRAIAEWRGD